MSAALAYSWPMPETSIPRDPSSGMRPVLIRDDLGGYAPLIRHDAHRTFCPISVASLHPREPRLCRCRGCGVWLPTPRTKGAGR